MKCPHCNHESPDEAEYCPRCQNRIEKTDENLPQSISTSQPTGAEKRHVTIYRPWDKKSYPVNVEIDGVLLQSLKRQEWFEFNADKEVIEVACSSQKHKRLMPAVRVQITDGTVLAISKAEPDGNFGVAKISALPSQEQLKKEKKWGIFWNHVRLWWVYLLLGVWLCLTALDFIY